MGRCAVINVVLGNISYGDGVHLKMAGYKDIPKTIK